MAKKLHWSLQEKLENILYLTVCGRFEPTIAKTIEGVSCKACMREISKLQQNPMTFAAESIFTPRPVVNWREGWIGRDAQPLIDPKSGFPFIKQQVTRAVRCNCHQCETCKHFMDIERHPSDNPWKDRKSSQREHRWPNVPAALEWYVDLLASGYPTKSVSETLAQLGVVGALIRTSNAGQSTSTIQAAEDCVEIQRAISSLHSEMAATITLARTVGKRVISKRYRTVRREPVPAKDLGAFYQIGEKEVLSTAKRGRRKIYEYLQPRGLVPAQRRQIDDGARNIES